MPDRRVVRRVAVIGSGLAGLTTAYLLRKEGVEVWLLEKSSKLGFHSASVEIQTSTKTSDEKYFADTPARWTVNVPLRSFQGGYYPHLISLYRHLDIPLVSTSYTFSFSHLYPSGQTSTYFTYSGASGLSAPSVPSAAWTSPGTLLQAFSNFLTSGLCQVFLLILAFLSWHHIPWSSLDSPTSTLRDLTFPSFPLWQRFLEELVVPLFSAVGTMTSNDVWSTPAKCLFEYIHATVGTPHYSLAPGYTAADVAAKLAKPVEDQGGGHLRLASMITGLGGRDGSVVVKLGMEEIEVDRVVVATQASAAVVLLGMLEESLVREGEKVEWRRVRGLRKALSGVKYRDTIVVTHRDSIILPSEADRRDINLCAPMIASATFTDYGDTSSTLPLSASSGDTASSGPSTPTFFKPTPFFPPRQNAVYTMATHIIRPPRSLGKLGVEDVFQTTNPIMSIDPEKVLGVARLERALPLRDPHKTLSALHPPTTHGSTPLVHLAGSYAYPGIPLLEGCVGSAKRVVEEIVRSHPHRERSGGGIGNIDWTAGEGGLFSRVWRWRREPG